jgi:hypothetical protein
MKQPKSAYLAGPMRNRPFFNFHAFESAMIDLEARGIKITSPHKMDKDMGFDPTKQDPYEVGIPEGFNIEECVRRDIQAILETESIIFLPGWETSIGATAERAVAAWLMRPCYLYPRLEPIPEPCRKSL